MEISAVLLDGDGVLLNSREGSVKYYLLVAKNLGLQVPTREEFLAVWAMPWEELLNTLWPGVDVDEFNAACEEVEKIKIPAVRGARRTLFWLKGKGLVRWLLFFASRGRIGQKKKFFIALISNRDSVSLEEKMERAKMPFKLFDYVQAVDHYEFAKPDPRVFDRVLSILAKKGIPRSKVIFVGDTLSDYKAAKGAGIIFIGVLSGGATREEFLAAGLDEAHIIESVRSLPKILTERI